MRPGMLDGPAMKTNKEIPAMHLAVVHATSTPERLTTQAANTGEDVETLSMLLESACYRERAAVKISFVHHRRARHLRVPCGRRHEQSTVEAVTALRSLG